MTDTDHRDQEETGTGEAIAWFDGILEGSRAEDGHLRRLVQAINAAGLVQLHLDRDGTQFSLLADDSPIPAERFTSARQQAFADALGRLIEWALQHGPVESTLRCTEVRLEESRESLFAADEDGMQVLTRSRPVTEEERVLLMQSSAARPQVDWRPDMRIAAGIAGLVLVLSILVGWESGLFHRALAAEATALNVETGPFGTMLAHELDSDWGTYEIVLTRGESYPDSVQAVQERVAEAADMVQRAAINAVADGEVIYCRLLDDAGETLAVQAAALRPLVSRETGRVRVRLPGHMSAHTIELALDAGMDESQE
ncbi:MAG: hypothetical protein ACOCXJ_02895 [Planctomycetota bacterium]